MLLLAVMSVGFRLDVNCLFRMIVPVTMRITQAGRNSCRKQHDIKYQNYVLTVICFSDVELNFFDSTWLLAQRLCKPFSTDRTNVLFYTLR